MPSMAQGPLPSPALISAALDEVVRALTDRPHMTPEQKFAAAQNMMLLCLSFVPLDACQTMLVGQAVLYFQLAADAGHDIMMGGMDHRTKLRFQANAIRLGTMSMKTLDKFHEMQGPEAREAIQRLTAGEGAHGNSAEPAKPTVAAPVSGPVAEKSKPAAATDKAPAPSSRQSAQPVPPMAEAVQTPPGARPVTPEAAPAGTQRTQAVPSSIEARDQRNWDALRLASQPRTEARPTTRSILSGPSHGALQTAMSPSAATFTARGGRTTGLMV